MARRPAKWDSSSAKCDAARHATEEFEGETKKQKLRCNVRRLLYVTRR